MAELFMECEEEELEPWQQKSKPIIVEDEDDDDEPIFVGEILSSKPANAYILNRVHPSSPRVAMQNGTPKRGFQPMARPATSTLAVQPQPREGSLSGTSPGLQKPLPGGSSPQEAAKPSAGISQPVSRSTPTPSISGNLNIPVMAQSAARPVATVTAQPVALNRAPPTNTSSVVFGIRQSSGATHCPSGAPVTATGLAKRPAPAEVNSVSPKKAKAEETGSGSSSPLSSSVKSPNEMPSLQKGMASCNTKNGAPFPQACPKCNIHFNLLDPLKNHMKYCCPDLVHTFLGAPATDPSGASAKMAESEKGKLIMLVNDFYYGKYEGNTQQVHQEQKTHTTFKCASCMKLLKNNIRFMNHMKHHLELEKQESWESHTTCQHCYRQFPTPFQLQCHIESTHTPYESSTICRICELSFETEQILLQHMKDNHKPGEMPYVCQVCNYRSSAFSDVEKHFRAVHENTKNLLCPFCLKVVKIGAPYMHHYMRHQKKGVHRCTKCRLQFLTGKEKVDHKSQHHRTFRKPPQLEGLPPGTKVTIRASVGSLPPGSAVAPPVVGPSTSTLQLSPSVKIANIKNYSRLNVSKVKPKLKPLSIQKRQSLGLSSSSSCNSSSSGGSSNKKNMKIANTALSSLRCSEIQKCIECSSDIRTFASHFPAYVHCSLCRYGTSCSKAYVNHMMSFHSARQSKRFWIYKDRSEELRGITTVCLNCDFVMDDSGLDKMATHLNERQFHRCQVIPEHVSVEDVAPEDLPDQTNDASLSKEGEEKSQDLPRPHPPQGQGGTSAPASSGTKNSGEGTDRDPLDPGDETSDADRQEEKASLPSQDCSSGPVLPVPSKEPSGEGNGGCLEGQEAGGSEGAASPSALGSSFGLGGQTFSGDPAETGEVGQAADLLAEGSVATKGGEGCSSISEDSSGPGASACPEDPGETTEGGGLRSQPAEGCVATEGGEGSCPSVSEHSSDPGRTFQNILPSASSEDPRETAEEGGLRNELAGGSVAAEGKGSSPSISEDSSGPGASACPEDPRETTEGGGLRSQPAEDCVATEGGDRSCPSVSEHSSDPGTSAFSEDPRETAEEGGLRNERAGGSVAAEGEGSSPSISEDSSGPGASACSEQLRETAEEGGLRNELAGGSVAAEVEGSSPFISEDSSGPGASAFPEDPRETAEEGGLRNELAGGSVAAEGEGSSPSISEDSSGPGASTCPEDPRETAEEGGLRNELAGGSVAAEGEGSFPSVSEDSSGLGASASSEDPRETTEEGGLRNELAGGPVATEGGDGPPCVSEHSSGTEDPRETTEEGSQGSLRDQLAEGAVIAEGGEQTSPFVLAHPARPGPAACSKDLPQVSAGEGNADSREDPVAESSPVDECEGNAPMAEHCSGPGPSDCSEEPGASAERTESFAHQIEEGCAAASCAGDVAPSPSEPSSSPGLAATVAEAQGEGKESPVAAECLERVSASLGEAGSSGARPQAPLGSSAGALAEGSPGNRVHPSEGSSCAVAAGGGSGPGSRPCSVGALQNKGMGGDAPGGEEHTGERISKRPLGDEPCPGSEGQQQGSDLEEAGLEDVDADPSRPDPDGDVSFEQFLRRRDEPESLSSDVSEQGSVHLEPLTPSEVLEHEATEILQKGGPAASSSKASGSGSEQAEAGTSREGSPSLGEAAAGQAEESTDTS